MVSSDFSEDPNCVPNSVIVGIVGGFIFLIKEKWENWKLVQSDDEFRDYMASYEGKKTLFEEFEAEKGAFKEDMPLEETVMQME